MKIAAIAMALCVSFSTFASGFDTPAPVSGVLPAKMPIPAAVESNCKKLLADVSFLQSAVVEFSVSREAIDTVALWPLLCSPTVESAKVTIDKTGGDITLAYTNKDPSQPVLTLVLQEVERSVDDDAPAYQIVQVGDMSVMGYEEQTAIKDWLLDCYSLTVENSLLASSGK